MHHLNQPKPSLNLRESKSHQRPTDHDEVQDIPQVPEVRPGVQQDTQIHHLEHTHRYYGPAPEHTL